MVYHQPPVDEGINPLVDEMPSFSRHTASDRRYCLPVKRMPD